MYMSILPTIVFCAREGQKRVLDHLGLEYRLLSATMLVLGLESRSSEERSVLLPTELSLPAHCCVYLFLEVGLRLSGLHHS